MRKKVLWKTIHYYKLQGCYQGLSLDSCGLVFSLCACVCFFYRYFKKDKTVWYFSRQLCKAFVSIRRLKTTEMIFIGGWSIIHEPVSLFKSWVSRKSKAVDKSKKQKRGTEKCVVFETGACLSLLCIKQAWTMRWAERNEANLYLLSCSGSHSRPPLLSPS